ncbi:Anthranilate synthase alpha subunit 2, chloroplastic [Ananas comosus]|uniref:anthranilate synthase n=1 Tax=Ananas comosus TaxID=4615 RepID=A0A199VTN9_ANACO|nr:Anthranilate synthase alpha subunit 2, chloroplastic [Ananas comosus]
MEALTSSSSSSSSSSGGPAASHVRRRASAFGPSSSAVRCRGTTRSSLRCCYAPRRPGHPLKCSAAASSPSSAPASAVVKGAGGIDFDFGFGFCSGSVSANPSRDAEADKFAEAAKKGNLVPLYECIVSDHLTPVLAYRCLVKEDDKESPSFLFESVHQDSHGINNVGRYSMVGAHPAMEIVAEENKVTIMDHEEGRQTEQVVDDPMQVPRRIMENWSPQLIDELPDAFCGGWVGYFSYDTVRYVEKKKLPFSSAPEDDRNLPDVHLGLYNDVIVFDHVEKKVYVIHWVQLNRYSSVEEAYQDGRYRLDMMLSRVHNSNVPSLSAGSVKLHTRQFGSPLEKSTMTSDEYKKAVLQAKEHILAGDIFQIVLSQRFERRTYADPFEVYRALRIVNPSPHLTYLQARGCILVASSPEILTRVKKGKIVNRPLAGTVRRGKTEKEDESLKKQLLNDEKQCAEHVMLVDLGRNDVGKVSKPGSVKVETLMNIERYSHVMHISSTVTGELFDNLTCWDALRAALPVGTVSGAPKVQIFCQCSSSSETGILTFN